MTYPIEIVKKDITMLTVDAIVNAANSTLLGGSGVDGAIHRAAGKQLLEACRTLGGCQTGEAKITKGYKLPSTYVIHTVGPIWRGGNNNEDQLLANCYQNALEVALKNDIHSIAFPAISTGVYDFPLERATKIAVHTVTAFMDAHPNSIAVTFCCFGNKAFETYTKILSNKIISPIDS